MNTKAEVYTVDGETRTIAEWAAVTGIPRSTLAARAGRGVTGKALISRVRTKSACGRQHRGSHPWRR